MNIRQSKSGSMKSIFLIVILSMLFVGCNMNPSKEARIQELESEMQQTTDKISELEIRIQLLEDLNEQLKSRNLELEK